MMLSVAEAQARVVQSVQRLSDESVPLELAAGRVLSEPLAARVTNPPCDVSAMDGYAVRGNGLGPYDVIGTSAAGSGFEGVVQAGQAVRIFTGAPLPQGADTIIIQEDISRTGDVVSVLDGLEVIPGRHIRRSGLDFRAGDTLIGAGARLHSRELALAAAMNHASVMCTRAPRVAILATGDELVSPGQEPGPHQIVSSSPYGLMADVSNWGGVPTLLGIARDTVESIRGKLSVSSEYDLIVTIGGASVGDYDLVQSALAPELEVNFWKIAMRPGKPMIFGKYRGVTLLGLPGNPVSAFVCALLFLKPLLFRFLGASAPAHVTRRATLAQALKPNNSRQDYCRCRLDETDIRGLVATPHPVQDSSMLRFLADSQGLIVRPPFDSARGAGDDVQILALN